MAYTKKIKLDLKDIKEFIDIASSFTQDINLSQNTSVASAKSIMGVMSLNLSKSVRLIIHDIDENDPSVKKFSKWVQD